MSDQELTAALRDLLTPVIQDSGLYLEEIEIRGAGETRVVQVLVDLPEDTTEGVDMDDIARVSHAISDALDQHDPVDGPAYELEVSSPGAARELKQLRHWKRSVGRHVAVTPLDTSIGGKFVAQLLSVEPAGDDDSAVTLQRSEQVKKGMPVKVLEPETWQLSQIRRAKVDVQD
ncbi:ribosome maturation factor RimP [Kocuria sp. ZOR0020]|uniref:ribosome maturation factor RimP n=1 Tax=Kocuria sp. ZOR0020 TaxID=1339234 RepID=UPI000647791A|nr:ribosome maturation factor RimP [Kocuria sp. ZOR0020]